ncbi:Eco57I restriction-modification methylase domain-containing protein [Corynebacterium marquesiae]|uniref:Eco57I restriction-modification methylase domain-containing protein n=1 Tax=Corynebacterium marquesiae TaxID=2913503 RepID=UPI0018E13036|nr:Eco57I restriction-modification methylase domain-containing protein [Corynebacterium marquesiae]MDK8669134.1 Eco57I restriction-modification methylase domain-containing protein [Corynebacterium marquesiae]QQA99582.1 Eco57I restriction-modification methylase domain-containing protein [Corynebacterium tuberculostearicum]
MTKKFDVVIGNPPYNSDSQGDATNQMPIYHLFMQAGYEMADKVVLITPARFLFNAGYTPKAWNREMLADPHLSVPFYVDNSDALFPGTDIKGGVAVTYRDAHRQGEPIGVFSKHSELDSVVSKVDSIATSSLQEAGISNDRVYRYTDKMHEENPQLKALMSKGNQYKLDSRAFTRLAGVFHEHMPTGTKTYVRVLGLDAQKKRAFRWINKDYLDGPDALANYKVALPKANGSGAFGEVLSAPVVLGPGDGVTGTFITIGSFATEAEAKACSAYISTKFSRALLGVLKVTQDNLARVWKHVPNQDFSGNSDIDWSKSISDINQQLYAKYKLVQDEIDFIETNVKPMD